MSLLVALLAGVGTLVWPRTSGTQRLAVLAGIGSASSVQGPRSDPAFAWERAAPVRRFSPGGRATGVSSQDLLSLLEAIAPALEAGIGPASALSIVAEARAGSGHVDPLTVVDPLTALTTEIASAAAQGAMLAPLWRRAAESTGSAELLLLAHAWSLTEDLGVPLASAVRTTAALIEARIAHERRLAGAVAGTRATVNLLTILPIAGPLLGLVLGIGPVELYGGSLLTQGSLVLGLCLAGLGRWWVRRMISAVARGPVIA